MSAPKLLLTLLFLGAFWRSAFSQRLQDGYTGTCDGKRVYMYDIPPEFNVGLLKKCMFGITRWLNFCSHVANQGLGRSFERDDVEESLGEGWYTTDPYMLEIIFHARMRKYPCLTKEIDSADAFFIPYYTGIDALHYLYDLDSNLRYPHGLKLVSWLRKNARRQWQKYGGLDHFLVMGRTSWDFGRHVSQNYRWGTGIAKLPHFANMTALLIERMPWMQNEQAVPYPTSFHPSSSQLQAWISKVRISERAFLFAFAGSIRVDMMKGGIRDILLKQCMETDQCSRIDCKKLKCSHNPEPIISTFLRSTFCLQPRGDTPTRRSLFDSMISGCIPVLFHDDSAYTQYTWHLPEDYTSWSVYVPEEKIKAGVRVENVLSSYSQERIRQIRENVIALIPKLVYRSVHTTESASSVQEATPDAFDVTMQRMLDRIANLKNDLSEGWVLQKPTPETTVFS